MKISTSALAIAGAMMATAASASAQDTPQTIPGVGNFSLPSSTPTPRPTPTPGPPSIPNAVPIPTLTPVAPAEAAPAPVPSPTPRLQRPTLSQSTPTPRATPVAAPRTPAPSRQIAPEPALSPIPTSPVPEAAPSPTAVATPVPVENPTPIATSVPAEPAGNWPIGWIAGLASLIVISGAAVLWKRRKKPDPVDWAEPAPPSPAEPASPPPTPSKPVPVAPAAPRFLDRTLPAAQAIEPAIRPWIDLTIVPRRAGLNLVTATADIGLVLRNTGNAPARNVRIEMRLLSARIEQEGELGALFATPIGRPVAPAFDLAPGTEKTTRALATLLRDDINVLTAAGRPMFVPIVAVNVLYDRGDGGTGQTAAAFAIGIERLASEKLAPFWLDQPNAMHETLGQRPHALSLRS